MTPSESSTVTVVNLEHYHLDFAIAAVETIFSNWSGDCLKPETRVTIKPNLLMRRTPEQATTTHPVIIQAVIHALRARGITQITIADSPGGPYTTSALHGIYQTCGLEALGAELLNYDTGYGHRTAPSGSLLSEYALINPILNADVVISIGKVKTHSMTTLSGGVKNLFGCIPGLQKPQLHYRFPDSRAFCRMLVELAQTVQPQLTILDGVVAMEGDGPSGGTPRKAGWLIGSASPFVADLALCELMGLEPTQVETVAYSIEAGLIPASPQQLTHLGNGWNPITDFQMPQSKSLDFSDHIPCFLRPLAKFLRGLWVNRPVIRTNDCIGCGKCAESCPPSTIQVKDGKAVIDYSACISCFCCHEMCPVKAIDIRRVKK